MRKFTITATLCVMFGLLAAGQAFGEGESNFWADHVSQPTNDTTIDNQSFYVVSTAEELAWIALQTATDHPSTEKKVTLNFILKNDIDLAGKIWTPICPGGGNVHCNGVFDGAGHSIKNVTIVSDSIYARYHEKYGVINNFDMGSKYVQNAGLIGTLGSGTIKNLSVTDVSFSITNSSSNDNQISVGPLVGWKDGNNGTIDFCSASGNIYTSGAKQGVGGLVGNAHSSTIKNSISFTNIYAGGDSAFVGGIIGLTKNKEVKVESCVYAGDTLVSTGLGAMVGAVAGKVVSGAGVKPTNTYFDNGNVNIPAVGNKTVTGVTGTDDLNSESVVCVLNGGKWNENTNECSVATENWSEGLSGLSLNGSDGYKVKFDANGGTFASGAKTYKILAAGEVVTADEIAIPTQEGKKFGGWATSADMIEPSENLGVAEKSKVVYAVWYDFFDVTFNWNSESYTTQVAKHGIVAVDGFAVPKAYESDSGKYYFTGWAYEAKWFKDENYIVQSTDTVRLASIDVTQDTNLYAVWTKAKTLSVTFNATMHGTNDVQIVRIVNEGDKASEPDTIITDPGYKLVGWYTANEYPSGQKYNFDLPLEDDLVLYAKWEVVDYNITYELDGGQNAAANPNTFNINSDDIVLANPTKNGASFDGWFYDEQLTKRATQISKGSSGNKIFYAKWTPLTYTILYLSGSMATGTIDPVEKQYGESKQLLGLVEKYALNGCVQDGWSRTDLGDKAFELGGTYEDNEDLMLYPHWTCQSFGIIYDLLGGYGIGVNHKDNPSTYTGPAKLTLKNAYDSQKRIFSDGWYREPTFNTVIRYVEKLDAPITVYARWYNKITFQPGAKLTNSGYKDGKVEKQKNLNASYALNIPNDKFTIANYTLDGWSLTDGGEKVYGLGDTYTKNENLTLYPHWVEKRDSVQSGAVKVYTYASDSRKEAVIDGAYTGEGTIDFTTDVSVSSVEFTRTFIPNTMSTLMLPFSIDTSKVSGGKIYRFKRVDVNEETGVWKVIIGRIYTEQVGANTPYLVLPTADKLTFEGPVTFNTTTAPIENAYGLETESTWEFKGVYAHTDFDDVQENGPMYAFAGQNKDGAKVGQFKSIGSGVKAYPMQAYLVNHGENTLTKSAADSFGHNISLPDVIDIEIEDENGIVVETGKLNTVTGEVRMDRWFDLKGRRLNSRQTVKGTYYKNGKKAIIK